MARGSTNDLIKCNLAHKVKERRLSLKMSQTDLAAKSETRQALISEIERGEANPTLDSILRIAAALKIGVADLFE
jgi:transcriptional regulator with XRE-family HTH domain